MSGRSEAVARARKARDAWALIGPVGRALDAVAKGEPLEPSTARALALSVGEARALLREMADELLPE